MGDNEKKLRYADLNVGMWDLWTFTPPPPRPLTSFYRVDRGIYKPCEVLLPSSMRQPPGR